MKNKYYKKSFELSCLADRCELTIQKESKSDLLYIFLVSKESLETIALPSKESVKALHSLLDSLIGSLENK